MFALVLLAGCGDENADSTRVFLPSSLGDVSTEIETIYEADGRTAPEFVLAGSARLVAQLADGAVGALLITADDETMQRARDADLVIDELGVVARNRLVFAVAPGNPGEITSTADLEQNDLLLGVCASEVPCGRLATEAARSLNLNLRVDTEEANVRSLTIKIAEGELHGGLIYATDALAFGLATVDDQSLSAFTTEYPAARVGAGEIGVVDYLLSADGQAVLVEHGFELP